MSRSEKDTMPAAELSSSGLSPVKRALLALEQMQAKLDRLESERNDPIAVVGMACRLPGGADTPERLWAILRDGVDAVTEVPPGRWDADAFYDPDPDALGKMYTKAGAFLTGEVDTFDAAFFGIAPREAAAMDPQQRLLLEVAWEALERAGYAAEASRPPQTGVFAGISSADYSQLLSRHGGYADIGNYTGTGTVMSVAAGRIAYALGLHGPTLSLDTACSSSLVAIHLACQSLRLRESDLALAGGVNLMLAPAPTIWLARMRALAIRGRCRTFDADADGFIRGEGCGIVVLKRASDALRDRDRILALIRGSAVNHDGRSGGLTAPHGPAQEAVIRTALANSHVLPHEVGYIEAHGTGTPLGDPIEVNALAAVLGEGRDRPFFLASAKTNFGHLEAAAGVLGLMKVVLSMQHGAVTRLLHQSHRNPHVDWESLPAVLPSETMAWTSNGSPRIAGVSAFGISGTNAHVIVEEAPAPLPHGIAGLPDRPRHILALSALTETALAQLAAKFAEQIESGSDSPASPAAQADICFSANAGRPHHAKRLAVTGHDWQELAAGLKTATASAPDRAAGAGKIAFLFAGQGSQYSGMSRSLYETHLPFRETIDRCARIWSARLEIPLRSVIFDPANAALLDQTQYTQPALFSIELALAELWRSWGIEPQAVLGHSVGEYAAAVVAGVLTADDALELVIERANRMQALPAGGLMAAVAAPESVVTSHLEKTARRDVAIAAINAPSETVISGERLGVEDLLAGLETDGFTHRVLTTSHAFHSPLIEPALEHLTRAAERFGFASPSIPLVSNLTGGFADAGLLADPGYWASHARSPVRFADGVRALANDGFRMFLEIGPGSALAALGRRCMGSLDAPAGTWLSSLRKGRDDWAQILETLGRLYTAGEDIAWEEFDRPYARRRVALPTYPFERSRHWMTLSPREARPAQSSPLGMRLSSPALDRIVHQTELGLGPEATPFLDGHRIRGSAVVPAAAYVELACLAASDLFGEDRATVRDLAIEEALILPEKASVIVQVIVDARAADGRGHAFRIVGGAADPVGRIEVWRVHATGFLRPCEPAEAVEPERPVPEQAQACRAGAIAPADLYDAFAARGADYGGAFRSVAELWASGSQAFARIERPEAGIGGAGASSRGHKMDPCLLDGCFQIFAALLREEEEESRGASVYLPVRIDQVDWLRPLPSVIGCRLVRPVEVGASGDPALVVGDLTITDERGSVVVRVRGLTLRRVAGRSIRTAPGPGDHDNLLYRVEWEPRLLASASPKRPFSEPGRWLLAVSGTRGLAERLAQLLVAAGQECEVVDIDSSGLGRLATSRPWHGVLGLFDSAGESQPASSASECARALALVQAVSGGTAPGGLWLVTRGAQWVEGIGSEQSLPAAGIWGLGRVIALEHPELGCVRVDLDPADSHDEASRLFEELSGPSREGEDQIVFRGARRFVPRLTRVAPAPVGSDDRATQLLIRSRGALDQLVLAPAPRPGPGPHQIEIRVRATGLNFRDVLNALGMYPGDPGPLGLECSGTVTRVGEAVTAFAAGDDVIAFASGSFRDYLVTDAAFVVPMAGALSFEEAATIPIVFLTAYHALHRLANLKAGERVLVHAAAGGVGMAAAQLALRAGAEVFGTAGTPEKRSRLTAMGVHHVMDSRSLDFADEILARTDGRGVDVVLNSLVGEYIPRSMGILAPNGRFVEIGKIEIWDDAKVKAFRSDISYFFFDLGEMATNEPADVQSMFRTLSEGFAGGSLAPLPYTAFPIDDAVSAFRFMAQSKHMGKVVVVQKPLVTQRALSVTADRSYLVTGGLGGLGLEIARWLIDKGARHLVLVGRGGADRPEASEMVGELERRGVRIAVRRVDVANSEAVGALIAEIERTMPPLAGVVHAAGRLDDALLEDQSVERFAHAWRPKWDGAWNLHRATRSIPLDFFVTFSSTAAILGSPGQANYAAANAAMDALAHFRRSQGLPALTINWGPWAQVGMASGTSAASQRRWSAQGLELLPVAGGLEAFARALSLDEPQVVAVDADWGKLLRRFPAGSEPRLLSRLAPRSTSKPAAAPAASQMVRRIQLARGQERERLVSEYLRAEAAKILGFAASDAIDPATPLHDLGFDSLMAIELSNVITSLTGQKFSPATLLETPTIRDLAGAIAAQWAALPEAEPAPARAS